MNGLRKGKAKRRYVKYCLFAARKAKYKKRRMKEISNEKV